MNKDEILNRLNNFKQRLHNEVVAAYEGRGSIFGDERFLSWRANFSKFLDANMPGESSRLNIKLDHMVYTIGHSESPSQTFWRQDGEICDSFIDSLITDVINDEYEFQYAKPEPKKVELKSKNNKPAEVFIIHGHDGLVKTQAARFIEKLGYKAVILHEQASGGKTIIEKIEAHTNVGFAIAIYTPDDSGNTQKDAAEGKLNNRARQNVIFEHGYLIGKLGRDKVTALVFGNLEMPSDVSGVVYIADTNWQLDIAKEMKNAGYDVDFNKFL
jgi:predicted nucleotide-binding protein